MSKDSSATYLHMHESRLADLFEDFTKHYTPTDQSHSSTTAAAAAAHNTSLFGPGGGPPGLSTYLPIEDIYVAPQYQPLNPEDEDDVVPDQHAEFGITRAMEGERRRPVWRDLGLEELMRGARRGRDGNGVGTGGLGAGVRRTAAGGKVKVKCLR